MEELDTQPGVQAQEQVRLGKTKNKGRQTRPRGRAHGAVRRTAARELREPAAPLTRRLARGRV